jgi:membrane protein implicated in regulation of membrane protease activity
MSLWRIIWFALMPVMALIGGVMLLLSAYASAPMFGLYLSIGAWLLVLSFIALPYITYRQWAATRRASDRTSERDAPYSTNS